MNLNDILGLFQSHSYLAVFVMGALYLRKLTSADSKFPITIPQNWRPTVTAAAALLYTELVARQSGDSWGQATMIAFVSAGTTGFFDGLLNAIFSHSTAPKWAQSIVFLADDLAGSTAAGSTAGSGITPAIPPAPLPPSDTAKEKLMRLARLKLKRRRRKARMHRKLREAIRSENRELGDHRRWMWMALSPWREECSIFGPCSVFFDVRFGRLYQPDTIGGHPNPPTIST